MAAAFTRPVDNEHEDDDEDEDEDDNEMTPVPPSRRAAGRNRCVAYLPYPRSSHYIDICGSNATVRNGRQRSETPSAGPPDSGPEDEGEEEEGGMTR